MLNLVLGDVTSTVGKLFNFYFIPSSSYKPSHNLQTELYWTSLAERAPTGVGGATGAAAWRAWRTRALAIQLPKQDLSLAHCRHIDEVHRKQFEDFVSARNEIALDIGTAAAL